MRLSLRRFGTLGGTVTPTFTNGIIGPTWKPAGDSATALQLQNAAGTAIVNVNTSSNFVGINTVNPQSVLHVVGAEARLQSNETNSTSKSGRLMLGHYTNSELPVSLIVASANAATNLVIFGGGTSGGNAATTIYFYTATTTTSGSGSIRMTILSTGYVGIGETTPTALLHVGASTTARASLCLAHGSAPTSPVNGDMWTTTAGLYVRINGATVGPLS